jgi:hypothetical protein
MTKDVQSERVSRMERYQIRAGPVSRSIAEKNKSASFVPRAMDNSLTRSKNEIRLSLASPLKVSPHLKMGTGLRLGLSVNAFDEERGTAGSLSGSHAGGLGAGSLKTASKSRQVAYNSSRLALSGILKILSRT